MASQRPKTVTKAAKDTQDDLDKSPSRKKSKTDELSEEDKADIAAAKEHQAAKNGGEAPVKRKPAIQDEVSKFLSETKSNADAITKTKKHEYFGNINEKAWKKLVEAKDELGGGLFRMRLGNMLRGARTKGEKLVEKAKAAKAKTAK